MDAFRSAGGVCVSLREEHSINIICVTRRSVLTAILAVLVFAGILVAGYCATQALLPSPWKALYYVDATVMRYYFGSVIVLGAVPVLLGVYRLGLIYIAGACAGWIANCVMIATLEPLRPTMEPAACNVFIVVAGALVAIVVESVHQVRRRRRPSERSAPASF